MRSAIRLLALLAVFMGLVAGCGDDGADTDSSPRGTITATEAAATAAAGGETAGVGQPDHAHPTWDSPPAMQLENGKDYSAVLRTSKGDIVIDLHERDAPIAVNNFVFLAQNGFYTDVPFHRVIKGFMIQGGDPTGTGTGGPGYTIQDEPVVGDYVRGTVAMARTRAPNSAGSQFFVMHGDEPRLPKEYVIFGHVTQGIEVVDAIAEVPVGPSATGELSAPQEPVTLESVEIVVK